MTTTTDQTKAVAEALKPFLNCVSCDPYWSAKAARAAIAAMQPSAPSTEQPDDWSGLIRNPHLGMALPNDVCIDYHDLRKLIKASEREVVEVTNNDDIYAAIRKSGRAIAYGAHVLPAWLREAGFKITRIEVEK